MQQFPHLKDPSESKAGVHKLYDIQQDLQCSDITVKPIPEINVLHLREPELNTNRLLKDSATVQ